MRLSRRSSSSNRAYKCFLTAPRFYLTIIAVVTGRGDSRCMARARRLRRLRSIDMVAVLVLACPHAHSAQRFHLSLLSQRRQRRETDFL